MKPELRVLDEKALDVATEALSRAFFGVSMSGVKDEHHHVARCAASAIRAYLTASEQSLSHHPSIDEGWRTNMENAPRDWSNVLLYDPEQEHPVFEGYYSCADGGHDCWMENRGAHSAQVFPTAWRPLPTPPHPSQVGER